MRRRALLVLAVYFSALAGCGYHTVGSATHLPPGLKTLAVPLFTTQTNANHTEIALTDAVLREFAARTRFHVIPADGPDADAVVHGAILKQYAAPLTYNTTTQQSSSFLITLVAVSYTHLDVYKRQPPPQPRSQQRPHRALARAHKSRQHNPPRL